MSRRALFLDRDGTVIHDRHYLADPEQVELLPGAADALRAFAGAGFALVVVTNQSGIARGFYTERQFHAVQRRIEEVLDSAGVRLDAVFFCPHHPDITGPCRCRKPALGMYQDAAALLDLDLAESLYVGDRAHDVEPAQQLGGRAYLVRTGHGNESGQKVPAGVESAADLLEIARREHVLPD